MIGLGLLMFALFVNLTAKDYGDRVRVTVTCLVPLALFELAVYSYGREALGEVYFWLSCLVSMAVVVTLQMFKRSPLSTSIQSINLVATIIHVYGLYCYHEGLGYAYYTPLIFAALLLEWLRLLKRTDKDGIFWANIWLHDNANNDSSLCKRGDS